jgi:hypothetical protein
MRCVYTSGHARDHRKDMFNSTWKEAWLGWSMGLQLGQKRESLGGREILPN